MSEKYPVNTILEMLAIPEDRFEAFLEELPDQLREARKLLEASNALAKVVKGEIELDSFNWDDDGKSETRLHLKVEKDSEEEEK